MSSDIIEFQTFINNSETIHKYRPFNEEIRELTESANGNTKTSTQEQVEELNTLVVPAHEEGFNEVILGENA